MYHIRINVDFYLLSDINIFHFHIYILFQIFRWKAVQIQNASDDTVSSVIP